MSNPTYGWQATMASWSLKTAANRALRQAVKFRLTTHF
jgi:hypothetical protein